MRGKTQSDPFEQLRQAASVLLVEEGPQALSVRKVAKAAGLTTMAIYSRYGGKQGLLEALCTDGFETLTARQGQIAASSDPVADLRAIALMYRQFAVERPGQYVLMFSRFIPSEATQMIALEGLQALVTRVQRAVAQNLLVGDPVRIARALLAFCHGSMHLEGLELSSTESAQDFEVGLDALLKGFTHP